MARPSKKFQPAAFADLKPGARLTNRANAQRTYTLVAHTEMKCDRCDGKGRTTVRGTPTDETWEKTTLDGVAWEGATAGCYECAGTGKIPTAKVKTADGREISMRATCFVEFK